MAEWKPLDVYIDNKKIGQLEGQFIDTNPSDEKLREVIAEKDAQIASLRKISQAYSTQITEKDAEIEKLKKSRDLHQHMDYFNHSLLEKERVKVEERDAEIARLKAELSTNWAKHESAVKKPLNIKEAIESINSGLGWVTSITISRTEWERLLTAIQEIEKDAERYGKLRARARLMQSAGDSDQPLRMAHQDQRQDEQSFDETVDALPEVES